MSILLAGGAGYIGSHTAVELIRAGYDVVIADNFDNSSPEVLRRIEQITGVRPKMYRTDVKNPDTLKTVFTENSIDVVIHFAGLKAVGESVEKPVKYYRNKHRYHLDAAGSDAGDGLPPDGIQFLRHHLRGRSAGAVYGRHGPRKMHEPVRLDEEHDGADFGRCGVCR